MTIVRNGWRLLAYPAFAEPLEGIRDDLRKLAASLPDQERHRHPKVKFAARVRRIVESEVPDDPNRADYRLKGALGAWRRVKFSGRYRLFFRFDSASRTIAYCWLNDENSLRKQGAATNPYTVYGGMLARGQPPADWDELVRECRDLHER